MTLRRLPETVGEITPALLSAALAASPEWNHPPVTGVDLFALKSPRGATYRAEIACRDGFATALMVKLHDPRLARPARSGYRGEVYFYTEVAGDAGVEVPRTYVTEFDEVTGRQLIIQEFLSGGRIGSAETMLYREDQARILSALANMHARWWDSPRLGLLDGIRTSEETYRSGRDRFETGALSGDRFLRRFGDRVHPRVAALYRSGTAQVIERLWCRLSPHLTLCHYDVSAKNVFLPDDPTRAPVFFDWGLVIRGNAGHEIAQFISATTAIAEQDRVPELARHYHERLLAGGVTGFEFQSLWMDIRIGCIIRLIAPIALESRNNPLSDELALILLPQVTAAAISTKAFDLLD